MNDKFKEVGLVARRAVVEGVKTQPIIVRFTYKGSMSEKDAESKVVGYFKKLTIGARYSIQALYDLFDDAPVSHVQFRQPVADDALLPEDAIYEYRMADSITATQEAS